MTEIDSLNAKLNEAREDSLEHERKRIENLTGLLKYKDEAEKLRAENERAMDILDGFGRTNPDLQAACEAAMKELNSVRIELGHNIERKRWWMANCGDLVKERKLLRDTLQCALGGLCVAALKDGTKEMIEKALGDTDMNKAVEEWLKTPLPPSSASVIDSLRQQLSASQEREKRLREALELATSAAKVFRGHICWMALDDVGDDSPYDRAKKGDTFLKQAAALSTPPTETDPEKET